MIQRPIIVKTVLDDVLYVKIYYDREVVSTSVYFDKSRLLLEKRSYGVLPSVELSYFRSATGGVAGKSYKLLESETRDKVYDICLDRMKRFVKRKIDETKLLSDIAI